MKILLLCERLFFLIKTELWGYDKRTIPYINSEKEYTR